MLVRADGRFRVEEQQHEGYNRPLTVPVQKIPDGMPDMQGPQETLADRSDARSQAPKVFESSLESKDLQQLRAILSAKQIREIQGSYPPRGDVSTSTAEKIVASILRDEGVQNFAFPDAYARQPYEERLRPLFKWLTIAEKRKGAAIKNAAANNCSPDAPKSVPMQFTASGRRLGQNSDSRSVKAALPNSSPSDVNRSEAPIVKLAVNLVLVRVVARDSQGRAVGTLRQEDFRLLDNRKPRAITGFSLEQPANTAQAKSSEANPNTVSGGSRPAIVTERYVAYFFDDIHLNAADLERVRSNADGSLSAMQSETQAAIFTASGQNTLDFTSDRIKLHEALLKIQPRLVAASSGDECPEVDPYMADLIWNKHDDDALGVATEDALVCAYGNDQRMGQAAENMAKATAQQQVASAGSQSLVMLAALQTALSRLAAVSGQRILALVSSGFMASGREQDFSHLIDRALYSDIVINALDARGLYHVDSFSHRTTENLRYREESASANGELLSTLANSTGGIFFHNNNDLATGFSRVAEAPEYYYVLGFRPGDQDLDGKFHNLTVGLNGVEKLTLQARKGYYARKQ